MSSTVSYAVAAIMGAVSSATASAASATAPPNDNPDAAAGVLEEITVTAQRRSESIQNVPISMQAFTAETLQQMNVSTFDDYIKFLPNVTTANNGPGQNEIFMRGSPPGRARPRTRCCTGGQHRRVWWVWCSLHPRSSSRPH